MNNWMVALQTPWDQIKYITNYDDNYSYLNYYVFFEKIYPLLIKDRDLYRKCLDEIGRVVVLNTDTGDWEKQPIGVNVKHTMEKLIEYNHAELEEGTEKITKQDRFKEFFKTVSRSKNVRNNYK
jgi:hypothetical protein